MTSLASLTGVLESLWTPRARRPARDRDLLADIRDRAAGLRTTSDADLVRQTAALREQARCENGLMAHEIIAPSFALVCEAARRTLGIDFYDVQIQAGLALARGQIAELATGEGKTFAAAFPAVVHALAGRGVHVMTVNRYLAERDHALMTPIFERLGLSVGLLRTEVAPAAKRLAYACDITYGPGYEFGFDYLRDQLARMNEPRPRLGEAFRSLLRDRAARPTESTQRGHAFAIVDEADSVLIDEATMPLVLAGSATGAAAEPAVYHEARRLAAQLVAGHDFVTDPARKGVRLTDAGATRVAAEIGSAAAKRLERPWHRYVEQALYAALVLRRDVDYIVSDGRVRLVDEFTGRIFADRTLREGLHQAVEAKEQIRITAETQPLARMSRQRFFRLYGALCGMTGTAAGSERELNDVYGLTVTPIPTRLPCRRVELPPRYFATQDAKWDAIASEVERVHATRQPLLVGTRTIEASEHLARRLKARAVAFRLLNGKQDEDEARIVARAGEAGAVTIATNMAGRGTDIRLAPGVAELGGLHVIGTERHESARVDRQLAGRAARQGDPGSCQFFVAADDSFIRRHAPWLTQRIANLTGSRSESAGNVSEQVAAVQREAERQAFDHRRQLLAHDNWLESVLARLAAEGPA
jgi:preprotein translocase subunit SecA